MAGSYRDEIEKLEALYADNPGGRVFTHLAEAYRKAGDLDRAREVLEAGLANHAEYSSAHVVMGRVRNDQGEADAAVASFQRVLELDPHNMVALRALGDLCRDAGRDGEAVGHYRELLALDPSDEELAAYVADVDAAADRAEPDPAGEEPVLEDATDDDDRITAHVHPADDATEPFDFSDFGSVDVDLGGVDTADMTVESAAEEVVDDAFEVGAGPAGAAPEDDVAGFEVGDLELGEVGLDPSDLGGTEDYTPGLEPAAGSVDAEPDRGFDVDPGLAGLGEEGGTEAFSVEDLSVGGSLSAEEFAPEGLEDAGGDLEVGELVSSGSRDLTFDDEGAGGSAEPEADELLAGNVGFGDAVAAASDDAEPELVTETMADLYERQGFHGRAVEVYRELLRQRPGDPRLEAKLAEAEFKLSHAGEVEPASSDDAAAAAAAAEAEDTGWTADDAEAGTDEAPVWTPEGTPAAEEEPAWTPQGGDAAADEEPAWAPQGGDAVAEEEPAWSPQEAEADASAIEAAESPWTGAEGAASTGDGPYSWDPQAEESESGPTIREYFDALLAWRGAEAPAAADEPAPEIGARVPEAPTSVAAPAPEEWRPDGAHGDGSGEPEDAGPAVDAPVAAGAAAEAGTAEAQPPGESGDEDDLEMFRAWLQSLKQ